MNREEKEERRDVLEEKEEIIRVFSLYIFNLYAIEQYYKKTIQTPKSLKRVKEARRVTMFCLTTYVKI